IHNWANKGKLPHARTEGRHLRFRRVELLAFLRAYEYPIPAALRDARPRVVLFDADAASMAASKRALAKRFEVIACGDAVEALVAIGASDPDAAVLDVGLGVIDVLHCIAAMRASHATSHVRIVAIAADDAA